MRFSEQFNIKKKPGETWFDPVLSVDTPLFIDPFLIYDDERGPFRGSHNEIVYFFKRMFVLIATAAGNKQSPRYRKAASDLVFPEVEELCLGYTRAGTAGAGSGRSLGNVMADAIAEAIKAGLHNVKHFEEVAILRENIGPDRISDITANLLRHRFARYTFQVCRKYDIPVRQFRYQRGRFDLGRNRWAADSFQLPVNPHTNRAILLVPESYLKDLPTINPSDFWDYCVSFQSAELRREFNIDLSRHLPKSEIVEIARRHADWRRAYLRYRESRAGHPYNLKRDEKGYVRWYGASKAYVENNPVSFAIPNRASFIDAITTMIRQFRHFVEENRGYKLLWNDNGISKGEKAAQLLFLGVIKHYCQAANIEVSPEADIGRGPVDFKLSAGLGLRALVELKLARNTKFWNNARNQLPTYMGAENAKHGFFVVVSFSDEDQRRLRRINRVMDDVTKNAGIAILTTVVDASPEKPSASRVSD